MSSKVAMRWVAQLFCGGLVLLTGSIVTIGLCLRASLPQLDGSRRVAGLQDAVPIERDDLGVPTILASNRWDAARALGFVHAQDRFFQMDLLRRRGAGELAELFGPNLTDLDLDVRRHRFRPAAKATLDLLTNDERALLTAYTDGVNAGLAALSIRAPEYLLLRAEPAPWTPEDSILVAYSMFLTLQDSSGHTDYHRSLLERTLPRDAVAFFDPDGSPWDSPLDGLPLPLPGIPSSDILDFRHAGPTAKARAPSSTWDLIPGSNSWGVPGGDSVHGSAIIANDMHLDLGVPNIWYRAEMRWTNVRGQRRRVLGVTLPGVPLVVVGCTDDLAWAFTNATLDTTDLIRLELDPDNPSRYRTRAGWRELTRVTETIRVRGQESRTLTIEQSAWGPVVHHGPEREMFALRWPAHDPGSAMISVWLLEECRTIDEALNLAPSCGVPAQNFLVGDRTGGLAWTLIGRLPRRADYSGRTPVDSSALDPDTSPNERWLASSAYPRHVARAGERLWTANNRILGTPDYLALGPWQVDLGARARQVRDGLQDLPRPARESDLFSLYRDDRALFLARWQSLLVTTLRAVPAGTNAPRWATLRTLTEGWEARASTSSVGYRLVRAFRHQVIERLWQPVIERMRAIDPAIPVNLARAESSAWSILEARPPHLLHPRFATYDDLLAEAVQATLADFDRQEAPLDEATWGRRNVSRIQHPLSLALPWLGRWLDMPAVPVAGDDHMTRVQSPTFGPSERIVVAPGHEGDGLFNMPGGQSGHFLSRYYQAGHQAWLEARPTPLAPGPARHRLVLVPAHPSRR